MAYFRQNSRLTRAAAALLMLSLAPLATRANQLADIQRAGVVRVAAFDANPPFGTIDAKTHRIVGYDVDFAYTIADALGVKLALVPTNPSNRIPFLQSGKADLIIADITITPERAQVIDFSIPYFVTGQQFLVPTSSSDNLEDYASARIGAVKGTTGEQALHHRFHNARVLAYADIPLALSALRNGNVKAITQDGTILAGLLAGAPDKENYKILPELLSEEKMGIGVKIGEAALLNAVNQHLLAIEHSGEAQRIYNSWFGSQSQVNKVFGKQAVLRDINFQVNAGEVVAICGPSGSGKSTLIRLINQLETLSSGEIFVHHRPTVGLRGRQLRALRTSIGFVFQQFNLYNHLTALDNVALALIKIQKLSVAAAHKHALEKLCKVGLADKAQHFPYQLSGGQQQRVAIARALATDADIILCDEPTSALDPEMIGEVLAVMRDLAGSGMTMIVVTHEMQFAREIADRVVFIDNGEILEQAEPSLFFTRPEHPRAQRFLERVLSPFCSEERTPL